jgi:acetyl esterase
MYLPDSAQWCTPAASPAKAASLAGLPPALIVTAEIDVLRDDGETYAARLREAGVPVESRRYAGVIHGFLALERLSSQAAHAFDDIARFLDRQLNVTP